MFCSRNIHMHKQMSTDKYIKILTKLNGIIRLLLSFLLASWSFYQFGFLFLIIFSHFLILGVSVQLQNDLCYLLVSFWKIRLETKYLTEVWYKSIKDRKCNTFLMFSIIKALSQSFFISLTLLSLIADLENTINLLNNKFKCNEDSIFQHKWIML